MAWQMTLHLNDPWDWMI